MDCLNILNIETLTLLKENNVLRPLIKNELLKQIISSTQLKEDYIEDLKSKFLLSQKITDEKIFIDWLKKNELSEEEFLSNLTFPIRVNKYCESKYGHMTESRFLKRKTDLDKVVYSLIRVQDSFTANELYLRINAKEVQFGSIAKDYSLGEEKYTLGIVGPVSINQGHPLLSKALKSSPPGELQKPFQINNQWIILRVESIIEATLNKEMEISLSREMFEEWLTNESKTIEDRYIDMKSKDIKTPHPEI
jgi:parvulin-like peptidyl-prolyl isomerase